VCVCAYECVGVDIFNRFAHEWKKMGGKMRKFYNDANGYNLAINFYNHLISLRFYWRTGPRNGNIDLIENLQPERLRIRINDMV
jgi:hypothetical protein